MEGHASYMTHVSGEACKAMLKLHGTCFNGSYAINIGVHVWEKGKIWDTSLY